MRIKNLVQSVANSLNQNKKSISVAESCTGGLLSEYLTRIPGSSNYFKAGIVAYSNKSKIELLKVSPETLRKFQAVSKETSVEMAQGIKNLLHSHISVSITGIAGPQSTSQKPIGLVYITLLKNKKIVTRKFNFKGAREKIRTNSVKEALKMILSALPR